MLGLCRPGELVRWTGPEPFADLIFPLDFGGSDDHGRNPVTSAPVKVLVVGAGIGGLCLAQGLLRRGVDVAVYERDAALESRGQGYRLHLDAGAALHSCLAPDLYQLCVATAGRPSTSVTVVTKRLRRLRQFDTGGPSDPSDPFSPSAIDLLPQSFYLFIASPFGTFPRSIPPRLVSGYRAPELVDQFPIRPQILPQ